MLLLEKIGNLPETAPAENRRKFVCDSFVGIKICMVSLNAQCKFTTQITYTFYLIVGHILNSCIWEDTQQCSGVTLQQPTDTVFFVYLRAGFVKPWPCSWTIMSVSVSNIIQGHTSVFLELRVRCLEENLDSVQGCDDWFRLIRPSKATLKCKANSIRTTHPANPPARPDRTI